MNKKNPSPWRYLGLISQLSISMITPIFLMLALCIWLKNRFALGDWVIIAGLVFGVGSGLSSVWTFVRAFLKESQRQQQEYDDQFK